MNYYLSVSFRNILSGTVRKVSKNRLAEKANLQRTQLNAYCKNDIKRPDLDVLARICYALDCDLPDIIRYVRPSEENGGNSDG